MINNVRLQEIVKDLICVVLVLAVSIPLIVICLIVILFLVLEILQYTSSKNVQWASWLGSICACLAAYYTRKIWINNVIREELKELSSLHYKHMDIFLRSFYIYIPNNFENQLEKELTFYYQCFLDNKVELDLSNFIGKMETIIAIKDPEISDLAKKVQSSLKELNFSFSSFSNEILCMQKEMTEPNKCASLSNVGIVYKSIIKSKLEYEAHFPLLLKLLHQKISIL